MVVARDVAKGNQVASMTQVIPSQDSLAETVEPCTHQSGALPSGKSCYYCKKEGHFSKFCWARARSQSQQHGKKDVNDFDDDQYMKQFNHLNLSRDTIHFGRNLKGTGHCNILFDEIDELE